MIEKGMVAIPICVCGKTRKYREWAHRDLKGLLRDVKASGCARVEFLSETCPDCASLYLPTRITNAPMAVFEKVHHLSL